MFLAELRAGYEPTRLAPSAMGGVGINRRNGDRKGFVEFYNEGRVHALFSDRKGEMRVVEVQADLASFRNVLLRYNYPHSEISSYRDRVRICRANNDLRLLEPEFHIRWPEGNYVM